MESADLNNDGFTDASTLSSAIPEAYLRKSWLLSPHTILNEGPSYDLQIRVANGQLEAPIATFELQFELGDKTSRETFIVTTHL